MIRRIARATVSPPSAAPPWSVWPRAATAADPEEGEGRHQRRRLPGQAHDQGGPTSFKVTNSGSGDVSEFEILSGDNIIGEVENVAPGLNKEFSSR